MLIDKIEFEYKISDLHDNGMCEGVKIRHFDLTTKINEEKFLPNLVLNLMDLDLILATNDEYEYEYEYLFTCTCGDAGCGGVNEYQLVSYLDDKIIIRIQSPIIRTIVLEREQLKSSILKLKKSMLNDYDIKEYKHIELYAFEPLYKWLVQV